MADIVDRETRSRMMAGIRGKDTKPEVAVRSLLHRDGFRFRLRVTDLPGRPDIVLPRYRAVVFVHGCFWHRHPGCKYSYTPKTHPAFWIRKFDANVARDSEVSNNLRAAGWRVFVVWECEITKSRIASLGASIRRLPQGTESVTRA
jgi:DNA mismatch endonuclease (patch repair protein)